MKRENRTHLSRVWKSVLPVLLLLPSLAFATLSVEVELGPKPVRQSETLMTVLTVTNSGASAESDLFLQTVMPASGIFSTGEGLITGAGDCTGTTCDVGETVTWVVGTLAAGETVSYELPVFPTGTVVDVAVVSPDMLIVRVLASAAIAGPVTVTTGAGSATSSESVVIRSP
jgi:hypothetical protein